MERPLDTTGYFISLLDTLRQPLLVLRGDLTVRTVNRAFLNTFATTEAEVVDVPIFEIHDGDWNIAGLHSLLNRVLEGGGLIEDFEFTHQFLRSGERTLTINARRVDSDGQPYAILMAIEDVTAQRRIEKERERLLADLNRSNTELERFAYVASHDLQEPLRMISSYTQIIARKYGNKLDEKGHQYIGFAVDGAQRMQALINGLLDYSRVGSRGAELQAVDMNKVMETVMTNMHVSAERARATITVGEMPPVLGDEQQLVQAFQNLLSNALKFRGEKTPEIEIGVRRKKKEYVFSIRDNGIGIDQRHFERMFVVFQRLHTREEYAGHGIGLAITKRIVERHGGRMWVESAPGQGSTFFLTLQGDLT